MLSADKNFLGRYQIIKQLEKGKMSALYLAEDRRYDNTVVLKEILINPDFLVDNNQFEFLKSAVEHEVKILAEGYHEMFPYVIEYFTKNDGHYLVMERIRGDNLAEMLVKRKGPFPLQEVMKWSDQLLDTLDYLHSYDLSFYFGDFTPQNLKINARGKIKMLDCGVFKSAEECIPTATRTQISGIPNLTYLPIERIMSVLDEELGEGITEGNRGTSNQLTTNTPAQRSNVYSLSATIYQMTTGLAPVDALQRNIQFLANKADPLPYPHDSNPDIPEKISLRIFKGMEIEPHNRYASAAAMKYSLKMALAKTKKRGYRPANDNKKAACTKILSFKQKPLDRKLPVSEIAAEHEPASIAVTQNGPTEINESQLKELEIQQLLDEQEQLRFEAERLWFDQENRFAKQSRLQIEAESAEIHHHVADMRQLIAKKPSCRPENELTETANQGESGNSAPLRLTADLPDQIDKKTELNSNFHKISNQNVSSETLSGDQYGGQ